MYIFLNAYHFYDSAVPDLGLQVSKLSVKRANFTNDEMPFIFWKNRASLLRTGLSHQVKADESNMECLSICSTWRSLILLLGDLLKLKRKTIYKTCKTIPHSRSCVRSNKKLHTNEVLLFRAVFYCSLLQRI